MSNRAGITFFEEYRTLNRGGQAWTSVSTSDSDMNGVGGK